MNPNGYARRAWISHDWMRRAACRDSDPELWFPSRIDRGRQEIALAICAECPVRDICAEWGKEPVGYGTNGDYGIYGGRPIRARSDRKTKA